MASVSSSAGKFVSRKIKLLFCQFSHGREKVSIQISGEAFHDAANHLISLPLQFHKEKKTGKIFRRISRGTDEVGHIIEGILREILPQFLSLIIAISRSFLSVKKLCSLLSLIERRYCLMLSSRLRRLSIWQALARLTPNLAPT